MINDILNPNIMMTLLKIFFVLGSAIWLVYSFIVFRQISIMKKTLITKFSSNINLLGLINLFLAVIMFFSFLFFL